MQILWVSTNGGPPLANWPGVNWTLAATVASAVAQLKVARHDAAVLAPPLEGWRPEEALEELLRVDSRFPVVIFDPAGSVSDVVRLTKAGAFHFEAGDCPEHLYQVLETAAEYRRSYEGAAALRAESPEPWQRFLIGDSPAMRKVVDVIRLIGARRSTVLIGGETGTGKEMVARAVHLASARAHLPMVAVNCTALPEQLLEAELFGHVKGAFTGAFQGRIGRFEQANRSTIFLDEIGDMPVDVQAKLLRVLQEREFQRIGSSETVRVDVRVIAASNIDMQDKIRQGKFREDLYYRLNVVPIAVPPLRERLSDIPALVHHFVEKVCRQEEIAPKRISPETIDRLRDYVWPGNVRQLENAVEMAIAMCGDRPTLYPADFPLPAPSRTRPLQAGNAEVAVPDSGIDFEGTVNRLERTLIEQALRHTGGNKKQAADMLKLKRTTLTAKLKSLAATG